MDAKQILGLIENQLLTEGYPQEEVKYMISKARVIITESVVTATYENGAVDVWYIEMKPVLVHRSSVTPKL